MIFHRRAGLAVVLLASGALTSGCLRSTAPQPSQLALTGTWNYAGVQTGPVRENLSGTLTISSESGTSFQGRLDVVGVNAQTGQSRVLGGVVSGSESSSNVIDFDAQLETSPRRHVGNIVADTITGTWVGSSSDGSMTSGTFRIERVTR
ncbi:MAG TPA: hypothetical protein VD771_04585 [Gemmatimonadaceae bacterium]|nr:hypothetical protein [Gemmatimonadaceae bacterium]